MPRDIHRKWRHTALANFSAWPLLWVYETCSRPNKNISGPLFTNTIWLLMENHNRIRFLLYSFYYIIPYLITMTSKWPRWRLKPPASRLFTQPFIQTQIKENIKAPRHWPLCGEFTEPVNSPHKGPVTRKMFPFDDVIMFNGCGCGSVITSHLK